MQSMNVQVLAAAVVAAAVAHFALLIAARWFNVVFLVCAAFVLASPLSVASELAGPAVELVKWGRVYLALLMIAVYLMSYRNLHFGVASWAFLAFLSFYTLAAIWSDAMITGIIFKGMYAAVALAGLLLASSIRSMDDLRSGMRILTVAALFYGLVVLAGIAREPGTLLSGRLSVWGWNANRVGHDAGSMAVLCLFVGLYDRAKAWKLYTLGLAGFFGFIVLATGSRAAAGMVAISAIVMAAPMFRRPVLLAVLGLMGGLIVNFFMRSVSSAATERLGQVNFSNRAELWNYGLELFYESPFVGTGWVIDSSARAGGASANLHSIYVQLLAETGLLGMALFLICLLVCGVRVLGLLNMLRRVSGASPFAFLAFALGGATLAHGAAESSTLQGTNLNGLLLPFAIGLLDRIPQLIRQEAAEALAAEEWEAGVYEDGYELAGGYGEEAQPA